MNEFIIIDHVRVIDWKNKPIQCFPVSPKLISFHNYRYWYKLYNIYLKKLFPNMLDFDIDYKNLRSNYLN
jgi:hypothetical protein